MSEATEDTRVGLIGKTIGRYRVTGELGRGGMATVYRAHDPQLGRDVAIKVMHGAFAGRGDLEARFRREARAVAAIKHDGIVNVFDFAPAAAGEPGYIVTEIVEGPTLRTVVDRNGGRLLPEIAALVAARIASALGAAHACGIVHRDVKPDNVMFDLSRGPVRVLLTDFGIARMTEVDTMTVTGAIVGSPIYMSPEQTRGQEIGPASDVFSLGVLLYQVIAGRPPFAGRDPMTAIAAIQRGEFLRPSQVDAHIGPALEAVILRCLQRLPAARFSDGGAVEAALAEIARDVQKMMALDEPGEVLRRFFDDSPPADGGSPAREEPARAPADATPAPPPRRTPPGDARFPPGTGTFTAVLRSRVAEQAFELARSHARRRQLSRALAETNRVFAYAPAHAGAQALLAGIARRRRVSKVLAAGLMLAAVAAGGAGVQRWRAQRHGPTAATLTTLGATATAKANATAKAPATATVVAAVNRPSSPGTRPTGAAEPIAAAGSPATPARSEISTTRPHAPAQLTRPAHSPTRAHKNEATSAPTSAAAATPALANAPATRPTPAPSLGAPTSPGGAPVPTPAPPTTVEPARAATPAPAPAPATAAAPVPYRPAPIASLALRASQGFCSPSMDDQPPSIHPSYDRVAPGLHRLYCTLPGRPKTLVANYDLRPGAKPNLVIVPGPDGQPVLSRPE